MLQPRLDCGLLLLVTEHQECKNTRRRHFVAGRRKRRGWSPQHHPEGTYDGDATYPASRLIF